MRGDGRAGGEGFLGARTPDFIIEGLGQVDGRGSVATPGGFLRGSSPSPCRQHGTWVLRSESAPQRVMSRCSLGFGGRERQRPDGGSGGRRRACLACPCQKRPRLPWPSPLSVPSPPPSPPFFQILPIKQILINILYPTISDCVIQICIKCNLLYIYYGATQKFMLQKNK